MLIGLLGFVLLFPSLSFAAYQNPTVLANDKLSNGTVKISFQFTGNAGEPIVRRDFIVSAGTTATTLRNWIADTIDELDLMYTAGTLAILQPGQTIPRLNRVPATPTAKQIWVEKLSRYLHVKDSGIVAAASDIAALKADLEATYQAGFIQ